MLRAREEIHYRCSALGHLLNLRNVTFNELATIQVKDKDKDVCTLSALINLVIHVSVILPPFPLHPISELKFVWYSICKYSYLFSLYASFLDIYLYIIYLGP